VGTVAVAAPGVWGCGSCEKLGRCWGSV